jgi:hypothetical protein
MKTAPPRRTGTVVWADLSTTDINQSIHFCERLLGRHYDTELAQRIGELNMRQLSELVGPAAWLAIIAHEQQP